MSSSLEPSNNNQPEESKSAHLDKPLVVANGPQIDRPGEQRKELEKANKSNTPDAKTENGGSSFLRTLSATANEFLNALGGTPNKHPIHLFGGRKASGDASKSDLVTLARDLSAENRQLRSAAEEKQQIDTRRRDLDSTDKSSA